jgi:hypothetical protein
MTYRFLVLTIALVALFMPMNSFALTHTTLSHPLGVTILDHDGLGPKQDVDVKEGSGFLELYTGPSANNPLISAKALVQNEPAALAHSREVVGSGQAFSSWQYFTTANYLQIAYTGVARVSAVPSGPHFFDQLGSASWFVQLGHMTAPAVVYYDDTKFYNFDYGRLNLSALVIGQTNYAYNLNTQNPVYTSSVSASLMGSDLYSYQGTSSDQGFITVPTCPPPGPCGPNTTGYTLTLLVGAAAGGNFAMAAIDPVISLPANESDKILIALGNSVPNQRLFTEAELADLAAQGLDFSLFSSNSTTVPEPGALTLMTIGCLLLLCYQLQSSRRLKHHRNWDAETN